MKNKKEERYDLLDFLQDNAVSLIIYSGFLFSLSGYDLGKLCSIQEKKESEIETILRFPDNRWGVKLMVYPFLRAGVQNRFDFFDSNSIITILTGGRLYQSTLYKLFIVFLASLPFALVADLFPP